MASKTTPPDSHAPASFDATVIGNLVRDELDRRDKYLEFAQGQIEKDRTYFKHLYSWAVTFLAILVGASAVFSYTSVAQMRSDIRASVDAELSQMKATVGAELNRDKSEMTELRSQVASTSSEAKATVKRELENVRTEVKKRIDTEFRSESIVSLVASAAKERTNNELSEIIRSEASRQVAKGIKEQGPIINNIVVDQTKKAVEELQPTIRSAVEKETQDQVRTSVDPIKKQLDAYGATIRIGGLATLAHGDNRPAFDYLLQVALGNKPESENPDLRNMADATAGAIIQKMETSVQLVSSFKEKQTPDSLKKYMFDQEVRLRETALDNYPENDQSVLPTLIVIIKDDPSISVLHKAVVRFNTLTKQSFRFFQTKDILDWWDKNRTSFK